MGGRMVVIGASGGIGRAICEEAERRGWHCVRADRHSENVLDLSDADALELSLARLFTSEGPFDAIVYSAGVCPVVPLARNGLDLLSETMLVNCNAFILAMRQFAARGVHGGRGSVAIAISSVSAREGWAGGIAYCASKAALSAACRALDAELAPRRIRVLAIEPRYVLTDMFRNCAGRMGVPDSVAVEPVEIACDVMERIEIGIKEFCANEVEAGK